MEKTKKKLSKRAVIIVSIVLVAVIVVSGVFIYKYATNEKLYTFDEITNGLSEQVSYVVDGDGVLSQEEIDEIYERYKKVYYLEKDGSEHTTIIRDGNDERSHLKFYDLNNEFLFEIFERKYSSIVHFYNEEHNYKIIRK